MKILICGDRKWLGYNTIRKWLLGKQFATSTPLEVVQGEAKGADRLAARAARSLGMTVHSHPALWSKYGRAAGPIRNQEMLDSHSDIELVMAFHSNIEESKGTADMVRRAKKAGIITQVMASGGLD